MGVRDAIEASATRSMAMIEGARKDEERAVARGIVGHVEVTWTEMARVGYGHHRCAWCKVETPVPPQDVLIDWAKRRPRDWLWPSSDRRDGWQPNGWTFDDGEIRCPDCSKAAAEALIAARAGRLP